ncbi:hypothetical protein [Actinoalloteichus sp. GBA129-24]|uniref:hypothetical protein n=1 Tax=Actinoalloteichus sp. GBA129-24 TaxID=1612551 RepID=UPI0012FC3412|nr:hypothetical protein [Actinoalloteichus sp. GBA129-24]
MELSIRLHNDRAAARVWHRIAHVWIDAACLAARSENPRALRYLDRLPALVTGTEPGGLDVAETLVALARAVHQFGIGVDDDSMPDTASVGGCGATQPTDPIFAALVAVVGPESEGVGSMTISIAVVAVLLFIGWRRSWGYGLMLTLSYALGALTAVWGLPVIQSVIGGITTAVSAIVSSFGG